MYKKVEFLFKDDDIRKPLSIKKQTSEDPANNVDLGIGMLLNPYVFTNKCDIIIKTQQTNLITEKLLTSKEIFVFVFIKLFIYPIK